MVVTPKVPPQTPDVSMGTGDRWWSAWMLGVVVLACLLRVAEVEAVRSWLERVLTFAQGR